MLTPEMGNSAYDFMVTNNIPFREAAIDMMKDIISAKIDMPTELVFIEFGDMLARLGVRTGTFARRNRLPSLLDTENGRSLARSILLVTCMNEFAHFEWDRKVDDFSLENIIDAFTMKLIMPSWVFDDTTRNRIDNVIAYHVMPATKGFRRHAVAIDRKLAQAGTVNYLTEQFDTGAVSAEAAAAMRPFLYSGGGGGWLNAGNSTYVAQSSIPNSGLFMNHRHDDVLYNHLVAPDFREGDDVPQHNYLSEMYRWLIADRRNIQFGRPNRNDEDTIVSLLEALYVSGDAISDMVYHMERRIAKLSMISLCRPISVPAALRPRPRRMHTIPIPVLAPLSMVRLVKWDQFMPLFIGDDLLRLGWAVREEIERFSWLRHFVDTLIPKHKMTKAERVDWVFQHTNFQSGVDELLKQYIIGTPSIQTLKFPALNTLNKFWSDRLYAAYKYIDDMAPWLGYAPRFYFDPDPDQQEDAIFKREYRARRVPPALIIDEQMLRRLLRRREFTRYVANAVQSRSVIQFNIPIQYNITEFDSILSSFEQSDPYTTLDSPGSVDADVKILAITMYRQLKEVFFADEANVNATFIPPRWFVDASPSIRDNLATIISSFHSRGVSLRSEVQPYDTITFVPINSLKHDPALVL
jgi:hypothetical protein